MSLPPIPPPYDDDSLPPATYNNCAKLGIMTPKHIIWFKTKRAQNNFWEHYNNGRVDKIKAMLKRGSAVKLNIKQPA